MEAEISKFKNMKKGVVNVQNVKFKDGKIERKIKIKQKKIGLEGKRKGRGLSSEKKIEGVGNK